MALLVNLKFNNFLLIVAQHICFPIAANYINNPIPVVSYPRAKVHRSQRQLQNRKQGRLC